MSEGYTDLKSLKVLYEISALIQSDSAVEDKFAQALQQVRDTVKCHSASLFIYDDNCGKLVEAATVGTRVDLIESIDFDLGPGFSAWVAKQRRSVLIPNLRSENRSQFHSFGSVPLINCDTLIGVMNFGHREPNALNEGHIQFLEIVAVQFAHVIARARIEQKLKEKNEALIRAQEEIHKQQQQIIEMEKNQVLAQVAASINHEINNPLTTIMGNIDLILITTPNLDAGLRKKLTTVLGEARRIAEITKKIRNMKRIVIEDYLTRTGDTMIDIDSSSTPSGEPENLS